MDKHVTEHSVIYATAVKDRTAWLCLAVDLVSGVGFEMHCQLVSSNPPDGTKLNYALMNP